MTIGAEKEGVVYQEKRVGEEEGCVEVSTEAKGYYNLGNNRSK
jgi:hypothetical protein